MRNVSSPDAASRAALPAMKRLKASIQDNALASTRELDQLRLQHMRELVAEIARHECEVARLKRSHDSERLHQEAEVSRYLVLAMIRRQRRERRLLVARLETSRLRNSEEI